MGKVQASYISSEPSVSKMNLSINVPPNECGDHQCQPLYRPAT